MTWLNWLWRGPAWLLCITLILLVRAYQYLLRPLLPASCRFYPSCSEYFILAVKKHGPIRGAVQGLWRIGRCNPLCEGGYDPP